MSPYHWPSWKRLYMSLRHAGVGLAILWRHENSFRFDVVAAVLALAASTLLRVTTLEFVAILLTCMLVITLEVINTAVEKYIDVIEPKFSPHAKAAKDVMAGAALIAAIGAIVVGAMILGPRALEFVGMSTFPYTS